MARAAPADRHHYLLRRNEKAARHAGRLKGGSVRNGPLDYPEESLELLCRDLGRNDGRVGWNGLSQQRLRNADENVASDPTVHVLAHRKLPWNGQALMSCLYAEILSGLAARQVWE